MPERDRDREFVIPAAEPGFAGVFQRFLEGPSSKSSPKPQALVHGVFTPPGLIYQHLVERLEKTGYHLVDFRWPQVTARSVQDLTRCPFDYTNDPEAVLVLDLTLDSLVETFNFGRQWIADNHGPRFRPTSLLAEESQLRLHKNALDFQPRTLQWRRLKLDANRGMPPRSVRGVNPPGTALLFAAAQHPHRVAAIDYNTYCAWSLPGLQCAVFTARSFAEVPKIGKDGEMVELTADGDDVDDEGIGVPVYCE